EKLSFTQEDIAMNGAAVECRIYAENPQNNFLPSPGRINRLEITSGPGVRYDSGSYQGRDVPIFFYLLLSNLFVWAETRELAINRLSRVLNEYTVEGIQTTLPFFRALVTNEAFRRGQFDTGFIDRFWNNGRLRNTDDESGNEIADIAVIASILHTTA